MNMILKGFVVHLHYAMVTEVLCPFLEISFNGVFRSELFIEPISRNIFRWLTVTTTVPLTLVTHKNTTFNEIRKSQ